MKRSEFNEITWKKYGSKKRKWNNNQLYEYQ